MSLVRVWGMAWGLQLLASSGLLGLYMDLCQKIVQGMQSLCTCVGRYIEEGRGLISRAIPTKGFSGPSSCVIGIGHVSLEHHNATCSYTNHLIASILRRM